MSGNEHVMAIREALKEVHTLTFEGDTIGIRRVLSGPQNVYLDAIAAELDEANARAARLRKAVILLVNRLNAARGYEDQTGVQIESDLSWEDLHLRYGDLDAAPGGTEGETQP